jgi:predicted Zn-dependent protease
MAARHARLAFAASLAVFAAGCIQDDGTRYDPIPGRQRASAESEREMGWMFDRKAQEVLPLVTDLQVLEFVDDLGNVLVERLGEQPFDYRFRVVVSPELNAFAVPGGYIYLHTGTLLAVSDIEELAGVLAHELAHVKGHHQARRAQETAIPNLLTTLAGVAAGVAAQNAGPMLAAEGLNVALQLQYTRGLEDEADRVGAVFLTRSGYGTEGMVRFFERILLEQSKLPEQQVPAYLYSHPQVDTRIEVVRGLGEKMKPTTAPPRLDERFRQMQARLAYVVAKGRSVPLDVAPYDRAVAQPLLDRANAAKDAGDFDAALAALADAESRAPNDPRVPVLRGDVLMQQRRPADAAVAYRRAIRLDPSPPTVLLALSRAHRDAGNRREAIFFAEQAVWRTGSKGVLRAQAERQLERLLFPVVAEWGFGDEPTPRREAMQGTAAAAAPRFDRTAGEIAWWSRIGAHWVPWISYVRVRWVAPDGSVAREEKPDRSKRVYLADALALDDATPGAWRVDVLLADDVVDSQPFVVE